MANTTLTGYVDQLAGDTGSNHGFKVVIDFANTFDNMINEADDQEFINDIGNWQDFGEIVDAVLTQYGTEDCAILGNTHVDAVDQNVWAYLTTDSVNRWIEPFETGCEYQLSIDVKSADVTQFVVKLQTSGVDPYETPPYSFTFTDVKTGWETFTSNFVHTSETRFLHLVIGGYFEKDADIHFDNVTITKVTSSSMTDSDFQVIEFDAFELGDETSDLEKLFVGNIKHSMTIRPLLTLSTGWQDVLLEWQSAFTLENVRVTYYRGTKSGSTITYTNKFWRGKIDNQSVKADVIQTTISFEVVDYLLALKDVSTYTNLCKYNVASYSSVSNYIRFIDVIIDILNYFDETDPDDNFHTEAKLTNYCDITGYDNGGQYATISGYQNGGADGTSRKYLAISGWKYFQKIGEDSPYASTYGELLGEFAFAILSKIQVGLEGKIYIEPLYTTGMSHTSETIDIDNCIDIETGVIPLAYKGIRIKHKGTWTDTNTLYEQTSWLPSKSSVMSGDTLRDGCLDKVLTFLSDWVDSENPFATSADWYSYKDLGGTKSWSYFFTPSTYVITNQERWKASYRNNGVTFTTDQMHFVNLWFLLFQQTLYLPKRYYKLTVTGTGYDFSKWYTMGSDTKVFKIQSMKIDYVENQTELYLLEA